MDKIALQSALLERFLRYVAVPSQSDASAQQVPSTPGQLELARLLRAELDELGARTHIDEHGVLYAEFAAAPGAADAPTIGFCAHLDTIDVGLSPIIRPQVLRYEGADLDLGCAVFKASEHPEAAPYVGQDCVFSSGDSVLGADDKAAIAVIMQLCAARAAGELGGGRLLVCFVPDEEIGLRGSKLADLARFAPEFAYTIDCCGKGELVYETFNAAAAVLKITGVSAHPMSAKGVLINPILLGYEVFSRLDPAARPELTEGREGYVWLNGISGGQNTARLEFSIRDHCAQGFAAKKRELEAAVQAVAAEHPRARLELEITDTYANIKDALNEQNRGALDRLFAAFSAEQIEPNVIAMRGGTDGSAFAVRGLFTPNFFTGAHNFHSRFEFLPLPSLVASYRIATRLVQG